LIAVLSLIVVATGVQNAVATTTSKAYLLIPLPFNFEVGDWTLNLW